MINQIAPVLPSTSSHEGIKKGLVPAQHIQVKLKDQSTDDSQPVDGILWSPGYAGPFLVPIIRWIE
jgi:hypothetical protein